MSVPRNGQSTPQPWLPRRSDSTPPGRIGGRRPGRPGGASGRWIARSAIAADLPTYRVVPVPSWSLFERRTVTRSDPSLRNSTSGQVSAAASDRRSMASPHDRCERDVHLTAEGGRAGPLNSAARSRTPQMGSRTDRGQPLLREGGGLSRGPALACRLAGESAQHPAHAFRYRKLSHAPSRLSHPCAACPYLVCRPLRPAAASLRPNG